MIGQQWMYIKLIGSHHTGTELGNVVVLYIPDPICRGEVPGTWRQLRTHRTRWYMQLASRLWDAEGRGKGQ
ncbi:hypothetical protein J7E78_02155 [Paenibacillus polymyxa]|uniref:hypothetical protein n=1 Tax=Paenibacillus polymyxa TaxID=1406 RepID=UPI001BE9F8D3|nr:hypothetical protein [Paenibacillus polymyxa]MBT2282357.1 hypothetical protein [Paenibacillus polymyxa]